MLEENVALLESRLQELQEDRIPTESLFLHNPYPASSYTATLPTPTLTSGAHTETWMWWEQEELPARLSEMLYVFL